MDKVSAAAGAVEDEFAGTVVDDSKNSSNDSITATFSFRRADAVLFTRGTFQRRKDAGRLAL
jgi:hypothetical protein